MQTLWQDLRYGARMLVKQPGFTLIAVLTLGLGIGASTAIFSAVNPILFESLPYPQANRLVMIWEGQNDGGRNMTTFGAYRSFVERSRAFESLTVMRTWQPILSGEQQPESLAESLEGQRVSASYFQTLGVRPALGRDFQAADDQFNGPRTAIISDGLWRRRFNGDGAIIGQQVKLDDNLYTIIGVMPRAFENVLTPAAELWTPLQYDPSLPPNGREWGHHLRLLGRLRAGATTEQAAVELEQLLRDLASTWPQGLPTYGAPGKYLVHSLQEEITGAIKPALFAVSGAVVLLLLITCVNVTNLLLARGAQRRSEFAVRAALGAGRTRMIRQLLTESLLLALLGSAIGLLVAQYGVDALIAFSPPGLPRVEAIRVDSTVFAFAFGIATLIGLVVGIVPALQTSRGNLHLGLQQSSARATGGQQRMRRALVIAEVALALVLLVGAGLLMRSLQSLFAISPGFDSSHLLTLKVQTAGRRFDDETTKRFFAQSLEAVRRTPGVTAAAFTSQLPLSGDLDEYGVQFEPEPDGKAEGGYSSFRYVVTPGYFETMGIPLRRGRFLNERDTADAPFAVVISESLARRKFGTQDPLGKRLHVGRADIPWFTIVGVVGDVRQASLALPSTDAAYLTPAQWYSADRAMSLVVRARGDVTALTAALRQAIWAVNKDQAILRIATMDELLARTAAERRFALLLFEAFGCVALALAAIGLYGVQSGSVTERTREIGVRLALGAGQRDILALILQQGMRLVGFGVALGLAAALALTRLMRALLYGVSATDPLTFAGVALLLTLVALLACWIPARRATKVDPMITLRCD
ncbi:MAG: ABC transporter permease [Blastocatellia bacterium]